MKIWALSDIHQEFLRDPEAVRNPLTRFNLGEHVPADADVIVIAGDLDVSLDRSIRRIAAELPGRECIYTAGNHDFYNDGEGGEGSRTMVEMIERGVQLAAELGVHLLVDRTVEFDGVRFIGSTLWTDFQLGRGNMAAKVAEAAGRFGMTDYKRIKRPSSIDPSKRKRLRPQDTIASHERSRAFIEQELAIPFDGQTVVVTHHAPHRDSLDPRYSTLEYCYSSNLGLLLESDIAPDLWIHGHIHAARDYTVGRTRVLSNPRGYRWDDDRDNGFQPDLVIEIGEPAPRLGM